jgi:hypothetical protein
LAMLSIGGLIDIVEMKPTRVHKLAQAWLCRRSYADRHSFAIKVFLIQSRIYPPNGLNHK